MNRKVIIAAIVIVMAIPVLAVAYWLISPLFRDEEVNEEFAYSIQAQIPEGMTQAQAESTMETAARTNMPEKDEPMPEAEQIALKVFAGEFADQDAVHKGSGDAFIFRLPDGSHVLRFENFRVTNGPDLHVLLSRDGTAGDAVDLGSLKGNVGNQNYDIPADFTITEAHSVIIYCVPFRVTFSVARLAPPQ
jgi:hypothetical protein